MLFKKSILNEEKLNYLNNFNKNIFSLIIYYLNILYLKKLN